MKFKRYKYTVLVLVLCCCFCEAAFAQKKSITVDSYKSWNRLMNYGLSENGKYAWYLTGITGSGNWSVQFNSLDLDNNKQYILNPTPISNDLIFTSDSRKLIYKIAGDTLVVRDNGTGSNNYVANVESFSVFNCKKKETIAYLSKGDLLLFDIASGIKRSFKGVQQYKINDQGSAILMKDGAGLSLLSLIDQKIKRLSNMVDLNFYNTTFDKSGTQIAFISKTADEVAVRYFYPGLDSALVLIDSRHGAIAKDFTIKDMQPQFNKNGKFLFFQVKKDWIVTKDTDVITTEVDVWTFQDWKMQSKQLSELNDTKDKVYWSVINLTDRTRPICLESDSVVCSYLNPTEVNSSVFVKSIIDKGDAKYNPAWSTGLQLLDIHTGKIIKSDINESAVFSPEGRFIVWFDENKKNYFTYEIASGKTTNVSKNTAYPLYDAILPDANSGLTYWPTSVWLTNDEAFFAGDGFDYWQIDPYGIKAPVNITNGSGRKNNLQFDLTGVSYPYTIINSKQKLVFQVLNNDNYNVGLATKEFGTNADPIIGTVGSRTFDWGPKPGVLYGILKSNKGDRYLMASQTASEAPNLFTTTDLKSYTRLSDVHPQTDYNWLSAELLNYKLPNGELNKAILYKPENFDPLKKYPVIFHFYQRLARELFRFCEPSISADNLNVPYYVSNGYVVCLVDILNNKPGHIAETTVNAVEGAAKYLIEKYPWVNAKKMGIQGHSFGGFETNILIANSSMFAAAQSSAGISNLISTYTDISFGGITQYQLMEDAQYNMQTNPWKDLDLYMKASPVLRADKVTTPLLLLSSREDGAVSWKQSVAMFSALRRLQKPCWMLQYDGARHQLSKDEHMLDFSIRQKQFFDHYLMDKPAPVWMTKGVPAIYKGIKSGLQLDSSK